MMHSLVGGLFEKPPRSLIKSSIIEIYHQSWRKWGMAAVHSSQSRPLRKAIVELKYVEKVLKKVPRRTNDTTFDPRVFLAHIGRGRKIVTIPKGGIIFSQGDACDAVFYIQTGRVKLTVVSKTGKEATIGILDATDFFGEDSLIIQHVRMCTATALTNCSLMRIEKSAMLKALQSEHKFSDLFVAHLLAKNIRYREDLIDQLFNSSEKRLARILLLFAGFGKDGIGERTLIPKVTQETLAEMVGTTRPRVNAFMNKFKKLGFIDYNGGIEIRSSLLSVVLHE